MNYRYYEEDNKYKLVNEEDSTISFTFNTEFEALTLKNELKKLSKRIEYQQRVIDKSIKLDKINNNRIENYKLEVTNLKQENKILRKIINEMG